MDFEKMRRDKAARKGGDFLKLQVGDTVVYVCGPSRAEDDVNYLEVTVHYGVGPDEKMAICLDPSSNPIILNPVIQKFLAEKGIDVSGGCPVCNALPSMDPDTRKRCSGSDRFLFQVVPFKFRPTNSAPWTDLGGESIAPLFVGQTVWDGITDVLLEEGDICNPEGATLVKINRTGTGPRDTRYKCAADSDTIRTPLRLGKGLRRVLAAGLKEGGSADSYKLVADMMRSTAQVEELLTGIAGTSDTGSGDTAGGPPKCFGLDYCDDNECGACEYRFDCAPKCGMELHESHKAGGKAGKVSGDTDELETEMKRSKKATGPARKKA